MGVKELNSEHTEWEMENENNEQLNGLLLPWGATAVLR